MSALFRDRRDAGRALARILAARDDLGDVVILALPRGGVPVGDEIARALGAPLDVLLVRKVGFPGQPELAMGAVASGGVEVRNPEVLRETGVREAEFQAVAQRERGELLRREAVYRAGRPPVDVEGRTVILVDDGIATGSTVRAAVEALRLRGAGQVLVAAPVAPPDVRQALLRAADDVVCVATPSPFYAISPWYGEFPQLSDEEVREVLEAGSDPPTAHGQGGASPSDPSPSGASTRGR